jgi:glycosyltransferase involved in cell wall biosynthesis
MNPDKLVSVIIPTFNRADLVIQALESVINQDYQPIEIIVIDDGSTDNTAEKINDFGQQVKYIRQENSGEATARNLGIQNANGKYVAFLDDDDLFLPGKLTLQAEILINQPAIALVACQALRLDETEHIIPNQEVFPRKHTGLVPFDGLVCSPYTSIIPSTSMIRRSVLHEVGGFDPDIRYGEDWDLVIRIGAHHSILYLAEPLVYLRVHQTHRQNDYLLDNTKAKLRFKDHLKIIAKTKPLLNEEQLHFHQLATAYAYAEMGFNDLANDDLASGNEKLKLAVELDPDSWRDGNEFQRWVVIYSRVLLKAKGWDTAQDFMKNVWKACFSGEKGKFRHHLNHEIGRLALDAAFQASSNGDRKKARQLSLKAFWLEPSQIKNRGLISIFIASFLGYTSLAEMRTLHR